MLSPDSTLSDLALHVPGATGVFQDLRLDFCCGGGQTLRAACEAAGLRTADVLAQLEREARPEAGHSDQAQWERFGLEDLVRHVLETYHAFTKDRLEKLPALARDVVAAHGAQDPVPARIAERLEAVRAELLPHMAKEEAVLFPYAIALERALTRGTPVARPPFGSAASPIRMMGHDHDQTGASLRALREQAGEFVPPPHACTKYRALLAGLEELERDLMLHIHFENAILFPQIVDAEQRAAGEVRPRPRPEPRVAKPVHALDLTAEAESLRREPSWRAKGRNARTLAKHPDASVVLSLVAAGQRFKEHAVEGSATIQLLSGRARVHLGEESAELVPGGLLALAPRVAHDLEALEESALLITIVSA